MSFISRATAIFTLLLLTASIATAQAWPDAPQVAPEPAPSWGVIDETAVNVSAFEMLPYSDGVVINTVFSTGKRYVASASTFAFAILPLDLPRGAIITKLEAEACNDSPGTANIDLFNFATDGPPSLVNLAIAPGSGCGTFTSGPLAHPVGISGPYGLLWRQDTLGSTQRLSLVRVYYKLQVSPAPGTATFTDVPVGSALHQYVEALVAAGITAGCGGGNYCPNTAVTRGQIAVFLAKALGLHWAP